MRASGYLARCGGGGTVQAYFRSAIVIDCIFHADSSQFDGFVTAARIALTMFQHQQQHDGNFAHDDDCHLMIGKKLDRDREAALMRRRRRRRRCGKIFTFSHLSQRFDTMLSFTQSSQPAANPVGQSAEECVCRFSTVYFSRVSSYLTGVRA